MWQKFDTITREANHSANECNMYDELLLVIRFAKTQWRQCLITNGKTLAITNYIFCADKICNCSNLWNLRSHLINSSWKWDYWIYCKVLSWMTRIHEYFLIFGKIKFNELLTSLSCSFLNNFTITSKKHFCKSFKPNRNFHLFF